MQSHWLNGCVPALALLASVQRHQDNRPKFAAVRHTCCRVAVGLTAVSLQRWLARRHSRARAGQPLVLCCSRKADLAGAVAGLTRGAPSPIAGRGELLLDGPDDRPLVVPDPTSAAGFFNACAQPQRGSAWWQVITGYIVMFAANTRSTSVPDGAQAWILRASQLRLRVSRSALRRK